MKKITYLLTLLLAFNFGYGQTKIAELTFETPGGYSTSAREFTDYSVSSGRDYFIRTDGSNINSGIVFSNIQGSYYFAAQDIEENGDALPLNLLIDNINISGYTNLEFRIHIAEDDDGTNQDWDNTTSGVQDYLHISYDIDNSTSFNDLLWVEPNNGPGSNYEPSIDTDFDETGDGDTITSTFTQFTENITGTGSLLDIQIIFSLNAGDEDIAIDNIEIWGTLAPCGATVTWDGSAWDNIIGPDITNEAVINGNYNTGTNASFSACSLIVSNNSTLTIENGDYVEVQNDVTVDSGCSLTIQTQGSFVQNNDASTFTDNSTNGITLTKSKTMQNGYSYTYWSSPVLGETIENTFGVTPSDTRYRYEAANFIDNDTEIGNTNTFLLGTPDDLDDNGNDWQSYSTGIMSPGIGYATTASNIVGPGGYPSTESFIFTGALNNGTVTVPIVNNSGGIYNDWNFLGNPFPCAISVDQLFAVNAGLIDVVYIWDQATPPDSNASGSQGANFSVDDYAIINGTGELGARGDTGNTPNRYIPSGQGFFVEALAAGNITFNNSMRAINNNTQFFKQTSKKSNSSNENKLWLNLSTDNGVVSNQTLIGYVNGASKNIDATFYDAPKSRSPISSASLYSIIESSSDKYAIQGLAINDLSENETIKIGYETIINTATIYKLSISNLQGEFLTNNTVYLKDNLLNKLHNLSEGDYTFTSEVGEFNNRFEIVFNASTLSTNDVSAEETQFRIIDLDNDNNVQFNTNNNLDIKTIDIYDIIGRQLYSLKGNSNSETYTLSNLNNSVYIAKIELSNGAVITKKAVKK